MAGVSFSPRKHDRVTKEGRVRTQEGIKKPPYSDVIVPRVVLGVGKKTYTLQRVLKEL